MLVNKRQVRLQCLLRKAKKKRTSHQSVFNTIIFISIIITITIRHFNSYFVYLTIIHSLRKQALFCGRTPWIAKTTSVFKDFKGCTRLVTFEIFPILNEGAIKPYTLTNVFYWLQSNPSSVFKHHLHLNSGNCIPHKEARTRTNYGRIVDLTVE